MDGMSFSRLILEVAEAAGIARYQDATDGEGNIARIPSDAHDLDRVRRAVNRGLRAFFAANRRWTFLVPAVTLTLTEDASGGDNINGDASRLRLPPGLKGDPIGNWTINAPDSTANPTTCIHTSERRVMSCISTSASSGRPTMAAVRPVMGLGSGTDGAVREVIFWPKPDTTYTASARFRVLPREMNELEERHLAGAEHDETILAFCKFAMLERDPDLSAHFAAERDRMLELSKELDKNNMNAVGSMNDCLQGEDAITHRDARAMMPRGIVIP